MGDEPERAEQTEPSGDDLVRLLSRKVVGQPAAMQYIVPYVQMYRAGLNPPDRPAGIFLLLGPTGTGKTRTVEALAEVLHGTPKHVLKIDCGEYQSDHEVAKLIGAPPGYLGHRETKPMLTAERLAAATSPSSDLALVLFDEIEKAAPSLTVLLLGIMDKGTLRLGDNTPVAFEKTLIFLTSNLGAREMLREVSPDIGFQGTAPREPGEVAGRLESIGLAAVRRRFSPEFVNRIDVVITYQPLEPEALAEIVDHHIVELQQHVHSRLGDRSFEIEVTPEARRVLLDRGTSPQYGARELKRTIHRLLTQPLAALVADGAIAPGARVLIDREVDGQTLALRTVEPALPAAAGRGRPVVLAVDDNRHLLDWLTRALDEAGMIVVEAESNAKVGDALEGRAPDVALIDVCLPDADGLTLAMQLVRQFPRIQVVIMTGMELSEDEITLCRRNDFPVLRKPFLAGDVLALLQARLLHDAAVKATGR